VVIEQATASLVAQRESATQHGTTPHCIDQARLYLPARELLDRRKNNGDSGMEALRILKRRLSDVVYRAMLADQTAPLPGAA
jgi:ribosomal protein S4